MTNYFENCSSLEDLKKAYRTLAKKHHPDCGGSNELMAEINNQYEKTFEYLKTCNNRKATANQQGFKYTNENASDYINIINELMNCNGLTIEICGYWLWINGNTYACKDKLKSLHFRFSKSKKSWYLDTLNAENDKKYHWRGNKSMAEIRMKYGSTIIESNGNNLMLN